MVSGEVTVGERIKTAGPVFLILTDGCQLILNGGLYVKDNKAVLTVYGQAGQPGSIVTQKWTVNAPITINGGDVLFSNCDELSFDGHGRAALTINAGKFKAGNVITQDRELSINGGQVELKSIGIETAKNEKNVIIGWRSISDYIKISDKIYLASGAFVKVADGKVLAVDTNAYSGTFEANQFNSLTNKTLRPAFAVNIASRFTHGTVAASCRTVEGDAYGPVGATVTLTVTPDAGYEFDTLKVRRTASGLTVTTSGTGNTRTFTMPSEAVTVSDVTFKAIPATAPTITDVRGADLTYGYTSGSVDVTANAASDATYDLAYQWYSNTSNRNTGGTLINGATSASYTIPGGKNAGTSEYYYCIVSATRTDNHLTARSVSDPVTVLVKKADSFVTAPTVNTLTYDGNAQGLVCAGTAVGGTMYYALGMDDITSPATGWSLSIPTGTNAGSYYVWYKVVGDPNHNDVADRCINVDISKSTWNVTTAEGSAKYGTSSIVDLSAVIASGGDASLGDITDTDYVLSDRPSLADKKLSFAFKDNAEYVNKSATVIVHVVNATNYGDYDVTVTLSVKNKNVPTISISPIIKTYDGKAITNADINATAKVGDEVINGVWRFSCEQPFKNVSDSGVKTVVFTPDDSENIETTESTMLLTINKVVLTITAADKKMYVGGDVPRLDHPTKGTDYTVTGLIGTDVLAGPLTLTYSSKPDSSAAGTYSIIPSGASVPVGGNYVEEITYRSGTLSIQTKTSGGGSGGGYSGGGSSGGSSGGGNSGGDTSTTASPAPSQAPAPSAVPSQSSTPAETPGTFEPVTTTNPDGSTTTVTTDTEGTKTTETVTTGENGSKITETVVEKTDGTTEKVTETVKQDGSSEKKTEIANADGSTETISETVNSKCASEKVTDIVKADGTTIHEDISITAKGKETATVIEVSPTGDRTVTESVTKPNGNYEKTTSETVVKKDAEGNIIGETTTIRTEEKSGKTTQAATFKLTDPEKKTITLTSATTTAKNGTITITGSKNQFKKLKNMIEKSGLPKGVKIKRA